MQPSDAPVTWRWEHREEAVSTLWFDRPGSSQNRLGPETLDELDAKLAEIANHARTRVLILRSAKPKGFCAGADLKVIHACREPAEAQRFLTRGFEVFDKLARLPLPTIAMIHGVCLGGGLELALACRHRIVLDHPDTKLGTPEIRLGLIPGWGAITTLPRRIGLRPALPILLRGEPIGAADAVRLELADGALTEADWNNPSSGELPTLCLSPPPDWPPADGLAVLADARRQIGSTAGDHSEAARQIINVLETDLTQGPQAARAATISAFVSLCQSESTRGALADFFNRGRPH